MTNAAAPTPGAVREARRRARHAGRGRGHPAVHGFYAMERVVRTLGARAIDGRSTVARQLAAWRGDLIRDVGGDPSTQQLAVIELATRTKLLLDSVDGWLLVQPSLVNARKKALLPVVRERQQLADSLARMLERLGLERRTKPLDLAAELAALHRQPAPAEPPPTVDTPPLGTTPRE